MAASGITPRYDLEDTCTIFAQTFWKPRGLQQFLTARPLVSLRVETALCLNEDMGNIGLLASSRWARLRNGWALETSPKCKSIFAEMVYVGRLLL